MVQAAVRQPVLASESQGLLQSYLEETRGLILDELGRIVPQQGAYADVLYRRMLDYPMRSAKALRPALCIAATRALGGTLESVLKTAAVLELYHNAFLIHDDVEDRSEKRRDEPTLHRKYGIPIAVNIGDGMLALALQPLLENMGTLGLGKALRILSAVADMARATAEGQALELDWVRSGQWKMLDRQYLRMAYQKTTWYSFVAPVEVAGLTVGVEPLLRYRLRRFAIALGSAFQIQDDVLNLQADETEYGKEILGDLWEGKHTLILAHALRHASDVERKRATQILLKPRPPVSADQDWIAQLDALETTAELTAKGRQAVEQLVRRQLGQKPQKTAEDVAFLQALIERHGSCEYASDVARRRALRAKESLKSVATEMPQCVHRDFLHELVGFVVNRDR